MYILSQVIGAIGLVVLTIGMQFREKKNVLLAQTITNGCILVQYLLLGAITGTFMYLVNTIRMLTFYIWDKKEKRANIFLLILFTTFSIFFGFFSYKNIISLIAITSSILTTYAAWQTSPKKMRLIIIFSTAILIIHDVYFKAYGSMLTYILVVISTTISFIKYDIVKK